MTRRSRLLGGLALTLLALSIGVLGGVLLSEQMFFVFAPPAQVPASARCDFRLIGEAWNLIDRCYVDRSAVQARRMAYAAVSGMVDVLGDTGHSTFLTPELVKESMGELRGHIQGIGVELQMKDGRAAVVAPLDDSPAQKAGIRPGDVITEVDGKSISRLALEEVVQRILGPAGTRVTVALLRPSGKVRVVTITRARITLHNVTWCALPGTRLAHVRIASFSEGVARELRAALKDIRKEGLNGVILDLRDDPGGELDEAVGVASQFLSSGNVLLEKDAQGKATPVPVVSGGEAPDLPLAVLINQGTASAAEIVAGALRDARRASLVGETTFGTGTVLRQFGLSDGSALMLATSEWRTPNGSVIWHHGIEPQVVVPLPENVSPLFPEDGRAMTAAQLQGTQDRQLLSAIEHLSASKPGVKEAKRF